jgi:hypothetical protein
MKKLAIAAVVVLAMLFTCSLAKGGFTVWGLTEQTASVDKDNSISGRLGYFLGLEDGNGGLEPFVGSVWRPRDSEPQVLTLGAVQHLPDLVDANSPFPWIPELFLLVMNEDVEIRPYVGGQATVNFVDRDAGFYGGIAGVTVKLTPEANSEIVFEISYDAMFADLEAVPDNEFKGYMGFRVPF